MELSNEKSVQAAIPIKKMQETAIELDIEYLTGALEEMRKNHSFRESAAILNPNPQIHHEQQELNAAKLEQLDLMLRLAKNVNVIKELSLNLIIAKGQSNELKKMFE